MRAAFSRESGRAIIGRVVAAKPQAEAFARRHQFW
jgi:hypothetical protein